MNSPLPKKRYILQTPPRVNGTTAIPILSAVPASPPSSGFSIYIDPADQKLKALGSSGTINIMAVP